MCVCECVLCVSCFRAKFDAQKKMIHLVFAVCVLKGGEGVEERCCGVSYLFRRVSFFT